MVRKTQFQCVPPSTEPATLDIDLSQSFFTPDETLDVGDNLEESYQRLEVLL